MACTLRLHAAPFFRTTGNKLLLKCWIRCKHGTPALQENEDPAGHMGFWVVHKWHQRPQRSDIHTCHFLLSAALLVAFLQLPLSDCFLCPPLCPFHPSPVVLCPSPPYSATSDAQTGFITLLYNCRCVIDGCFVSGPAKRHRRGCGAVLGCMEADIPWARWGRILDIGGAYGSVLAAVLRRYPHMSGLLFDLPHVGSLHSSHPSCSLLFDSAERCTVPWLLLPGAANPSKLLAFCWTWLESKESGYLSLTLLPHARALIGYAGQM